MANQNCWHQFIVAPSFWLVQNQLYFFEREQQNSKNDKINLVKVIANIACSANGIIALEDGSENFISDDAWNFYVSLAKKSGSLIWGRKTHEKLKTWEVNYWKDIKEICKITISRNPSLQLEETIISPSPFDAIQKLESEGFFSTVLTGGSTIFSLFAKEQLIDEIYLNFEPIIVGKGIAMFNPQEFFLKLELLEKKELTNNLFQLHYKVPK